MTGVLNVSTSAIAMELKVVVIAMLLTSMDFVLDCFPSLYQILLKEQLEKAEPDFYH